MKVWINIAVTILLVSAAAVAQESASKPDDRGYYNGERGYIRNDDIDAVRREQAAQRGGYRRGIDGLRPREDAVKLNAAAEEAIQQTISQKKARDLNKQISDLDEKIRDLNTEIKAGEQSLQREAEQLQQRQAAPPSVAPQPIAAGPEFDQSKLTAAQTSYANATENLRAVRNRIKDYGTSSLAAALNMETVAMRQVDAAALTLENLQSEARRSQSDAEANRIAQEKRSREDQDKYQKQIREYQSSYENSVTAQNKRKNLLKELQLRRTKLAPRQKIEDSKLFSPRTKAELPDSMPKPDMNPPSTMADSPGRARDVYQSRINRQREP